MKHKKEMQHIPITSLYNIFYHKDRVLHNHEIAYNFITQNDNQNQSLFILLRSLEGQKLTKESLNDSFLQIEKHFGFAPKCDFSFIEKNNTYTINLLIITVDNQEIIDFNFIKQLNKENFKYKINLSHIYDKILYNFLEKQQFFLSQFDIIAFGGCDSFSNYTCKISQKEFDYFDSFHKEGGIILFMYDFFFSKYVKIFRPLADLLGYIDHPEFHVYNEITFNDLCGKNDIITTPFKLNKVIKVSDTHQTPRFNKKFTVFYNGNTDTHYYSENLQHNIASIEIGHTVQITNDEKKLFYNIICHLYTNRKKYLVSF